MKLNQNFQRGGGGGAFSKNSLLWGRYGYFLELHISVQVRALAGVDVHCAFGHRDNFFKK